MHLKMLLGQMAAILFRPYNVNSLVPGIFELSFSLVIFKLNLVIDGWGISSEIALWWIRILLQFTDDKSALVWVMAWCC